MSAEKHARELIAEARTDISDAERCQAYHVTPSADQLMRTLRKVTDALEAALPGDDDWQYGVRSPNVGGREPWTRWMWMDAESAAAFARWHPECQHGRRRRAGQVEILRGPVEEVPRG